MRIAIVSDIHGNRAAFEAVLADLRQSSPDLILHGGDLADTGSSPREIVDHIRNLGWQGVAGNTDQMLSAPETFDEFATQSPKMQPLWSVLREMAAATREALVHASLHSKLYRSYTAAPYDQHSMGAEDRSGTQIRAPASRGCGRRTRPEAASRPLGSGGRGGLAGSDVEFPGEGSVV